MGDGVFQEDVVWQTILDNGKYAVIQNTLPDAATVRVYVSGSTVELLNSAGYAEFDGSTCSLRIGGGETVYMKIADTQTDGVYIGNVKYRTVPKAQAGIVVADDAAIAAVYKRVNGVKELCGVFRNGEHVVCADAGAYIIKIFHWDGLRPQK